MNSRLTAFILLVLACSAPAGEWQAIFNGKDLTGWKPNRQPEAFTVVDGAIRTHATEPYAHLFYVGDGSPEAGRFKNFEIEATVRGEPSSNSGIYFHTDIASGEGPRLKLTKGYEVQVNSTEKEKRKTGSLYAVVDLAESPVDEAQWFKLRIRVEGRRIVVHVNDKQTVDYTEPDNAPRLKGFTGRLLDPSGGSIALQAHDPDSVVCFKEIRIRRLP
ncbi:MAG: DUF1080 domain-containing protein [Chthoniobacteraceae bacterium]